MSKMTLDGGLKEAHRHLIQVMTDAKMSGCADMAADVEEVRQAVHRIRERYCTSHPNARMVGQHSGCIHGAIIQTGCQHCEQRLDS